MTLLTLIAADSVREKLPLFESFLQLCGLSIIACWESHQEITLAVSTTTFRENRWINTIAYHYFSGFVISTKSSSKGADDKPPRSFKLNRILPASW